MEKASPNQAFRQNWLSVRQVADHLGVSTDTVYSWLTSQGLPGHKVGRLWKFDRREIDAWVRDRRTSVKHEAPPADEPETIIGADQETESRWLQALASVPGYLFHLDREGVILLANRSPAEFEGRRVEGASALEFVHSSERELFSKTLNEVVQQSQPRRIKVHGAGEQRGYVVRLSPVFDRGEVTGIVMICHPFDHSSEQGN